MKIVIVGKSIFDIDEVIACAILKICYNIDEIIHTEDKNFISCIVNKDECFILDLDGRYSIFTKTSDFHQGNFGHCYVKTSILYSATGLIWNDYGYLAISKIIPNVEGHKSVKIYKKVYNDIVAPIDAYNNNVFNTVIENTNTDSFNLPKAIKLFLPKYDRNVNIGTQKNKENSSFNDAVDICATFIRRYIEKEYY
jgi:uncharacterized UPF0160 family protein